MNFISPFYAPPVVLTTVVSNGSRNTDVVSPLKDPMNSWLQVRLKTFTIRICHKTAIKFNRLVKGCKTTGSDNSFGITRAIFFLGPSCSLCRSFNLFVGFQLPFYAYNSDLNVQERPTFSKEKKKNLNVH